MNKKKEHADNTGLDGFMPCSLSDKHCDMLVLPVNLSQVKEFSALRVYVPDDLKSKNARNSTKGK